MYKKVHIQLNHKLKTTHMKKSKVNLTLAIIVTAVIGTALIKSAEYMFGTVNVFMFSVAVTSIVGIIVVPIVQMRKR